MNTVQWIQEKYEWSMGCGGGRNKGQCPVCNAVSREWLEKGGWGNVFGHVKSCSLAKALKEDGIEVVMKTSLKRVEK